MIKETCSFVLYQTLLSALFEIYSEYLTDQNGIIWVKDPLIPLCNHTVPLYSRDIMDVRNQFVESGGIESWDANPGESAGRRRRQRDIGRDKGPETGAHKHEIAIMAQKRATKGHFALSELELDLQDG